jgi:ubiquinone/menaquinone biosynthesis C-methylase UbiE
MAGFVSWETLIFNMEQVPCNLCGSSEYTTLFKGPDLLLDEKREIFTLVKCNHCGLIYQNPRPAADEIGKYYPDDYEPFFQENRKNWFLQNIINYGVEKRSRIVNSLRKRDKIGRLLDIGCSTGLFLSTILKLKTWEVWGVEPSEYAANIARDRYKLNVFTGNLIQANYEGNFFDAVTLWDVLEHLPDPAGTLHEIYRITKPDCYLIMRIPNADSFDARLFGSSWAGLDLPRHYYAFSRLSIGQLLLKNGFKIVSVKCNIGNYPTFALSIRFWLNNKNVSSSIKKNVARALGHPLTRLITAPFFYIYGQLLLASEITVIAKKITIDKS